MAIETLKRRVCDIGGSNHDTDTVTTVRIGIDTRLKRIDLCAACAAPILELWDKAGHAQRAPVAVVTMEDIARKRIPRKAPAKKT